MVRLDFDQHPFRIFPPEYGFYFIHQDISIPTVKPFCYSEVIAFPTSASFIIIVDTDGSHNIPLKEIQSEEPVKEPAKSEKGFCVFQNINRSSLSIEKCDVLLPAIYWRVFGPASYQECEKYVSDNQGM